MNIYRLLQDQLNAELAKLVAAGTIPETAPIAKALIETPRDDSHGDFATNAAMVLAKPSGLKPRELAETLAAAIRTWNGIESVEIAGPGFINLRLTAEAWRDLVTEINRAPDAFGRSTMGNAEKVNVEYVSTNPTGPLHIGHVRGAVLGDVLSSILEWTGHNVTREYYVNDAGSQVDVLARSTYLRYREAFGETIEIPDGGYPGDYLIPVGEALKQRDGDKWLAADEADWLAPFREFALDAMLTLIREDLARLGIVQQFESENALVASGKVASAVQSFEDRGFLYTGTLPPPKGQVDEDWEAREQLIFRATDFGDSRDAPLAKSDGTYTYFTSDIAYHIDKMERGATRMIDVWGADHHGHVSRMDAAMKAAATAKGAERVSQSPLEILLCNLVKLERDGEEVKMSKRAGTIVTLRALLEEVQADVVRFMMLTRRNTETLSFDLKKSVEKTLENPLFYVQYAHARCCSVYRQAEALEESNRLSAIESSGKELVKVDLTPLNRPEELDVMRKLARLPYVLEGAARTNEPHRVTFYLIELAGAFHTLWSSGKDASQLRFIVENDLALTDARLALVSAARTVIRNGLAVMGVEAVQEM